MTKEPALGIRLEPDEKAALEAAAKSDQRALSAMGRMIIAAWLREHGWLAKPDAAPVKRTKRRIK